MTKLDSSLIMHYTLHNHGPNNYCSARPFQDSLMDAPFFDVYYRDWNNVWHHHMYSSDGVFLLTKIRLELSANNTIYLEPGQRFSGEVIVNYVGKIPVEITRLALVRNEVMDFEDYHFSNCKLDNTSFRIEYPVAQKDKQK